MLTEDNLAATQPRILIVDDSRMVRATLKKHLAEHYDLVEEADGEAAWLRINQDPSIKLVISDVSMPKLDGHGLLQRLRSSELPSVRFLPVIIISGDEEDEAKAKAVELGASDFITKSTDQVELLARIQTNMQRSVAERDLRQAQHALEYTATTDSVTGLFTQNYLIRQGEKFMAYAKRHDEPLAVIVLALDRYDMLSQTYPTAVCNKILQLFGKMLLGKLRNEDVVSRCEDQYFAVALPNTSLNQAIVVADRVCQATANAKVTYKGDSIHLSCSIGLACSNQEQMDGFESLLELGSARLAIAQDKGGNWIEGQANVALPVRPRSEAAPAQMPDESEAGGLIPLETALDWLEEGRDTEVAPHLPALLESLLPLLALTERVYGDLTLSSLQTRVS